MSDIVDGKILRKYEMVKKVGKGAYGQVWKVFDKQNKSVCALKKVFDAFRNPMDCQRTYREIMFLKELKHSCIIRLLNYHQSTNEKDMYLCLEFMESDLSNTLKNQFLKDIHKQYIFTQVASALYYLHSGNLIHRDIKPSNILVNSNCDAKLCDFGLVRSLEKKNNEELVLTENIATRWYKAPQLLLSSNCYGKAIDVWSLGCILAEMFLGKPIFQGTSTFQQLQEIISLTGKPSSNMKQVIQSETSLTILSSLEVNEKKTLKTLLPQVDSNVINLLQKIFTFDPRQRITIEQIIQHPFINRFKEKICIKTMKEPFIIKNDDNRLSIDEYRKLLSGKGSVNSIKQNPEVNFQSFTKLKSIKSQINIIKPKKEQQKSKQKEGTPKKTLRSSNSTKKIFEGRTIPDKKKSQNNPMSPGSYKSLHIGSPSQNKGKVTIVEKKTTPIKNIKIVSPVSPVSPIISELRSPKNATPNGSSPPQIKIIAFSPKSKGDNISLRSPNKKNQAPSPTLIHASKVMKPSLNNSGSFQSNGYKVIKQGQREPVRSQLRNSPTSHHTSHQQAFSPPQSSGKKIGNVHNFSRK